MTALGIYLELCGQRAVRLHQIAYDMNRAHIWEGDVELAFQDNNDTDEEVFDALTK